MSCSTGSGRARWTAAARAVRRGVVAVTRLEQGPAPSELMASPRQT